MVTDASVIDIREITEISELRAVEDLQKEVRGCKTAKYCQVSHWYRYLKSGRAAGCVCRSRDGGICAGLTGFERGRPILHSDMLPVKAEYRSHGLGYKLKRRLRERAFAKGIDRILEISQVGMSRRLGRVVYPACLAPGVGGVNHLGKPPFLACEFK